MPLDHDAVIEKVKSGVEALFRHDGLLLAINASERAICHRLAMHITPLFDEWDVDCEYNRDGHDHPKLVNDLKAILHDPDDSVFPDVIVHKRTAFGQENNLLVIEVKKTTSNESSDVDHEKLRIFTTDFGRQEMNYNYRFGLFLKIRAWRNLPNTGKLKVTGKWFEAGEPTQGVLVVEQPFAIHLSAEGVVQMLFQ